MRPALTLIPKLGKNILRRENHRSISLMNIDTKILKKNFGKFNSAMHKKTCMQDGPILGKKNVSHLINK